MHGTKGCIDPQNQVDIDSDVRNWKAKSSLTSQKPIEFVLINFHAPLTSRVRKYPQFTTSHHGTPPCSTACIEKSAFWTTRSPGSRFSCCYFTLRGYSIKGKTVRQSIFNPSINTVQRRDEKQSTMTQTVNRCRRSFSYPLSRDVICIAIKGGKFSCCSKIVMLRYPPGIFTNHLESNKVLVTLQKQ